MLIYLMGPFHLQLCTAACVQPGDCCQPSEPDLSCCSQEAEQPAPTDCGADRDCCIELASEPPIGVLQTSPPAPLTLPSVSILSAETLPRATDPLALTLEEGPPPTSPPIYILLEILRR